MFKSKGIGDKRHQCPLIFASGLQAIGTARRLGAVVEVTDIRPQSKEEVEFLGGNPKKIMTELVNELKATE